MDGNRFDDFTRLLGAAFTRKRVLQLLAGLSMAALPATVELDQSGAKQRNRKKRKRKRLRRLLVGLPPPCEQRAIKKVAMCHCPPGNPQNAHVTCIGPAACKVGHANDLPCDCVCGDVPEGCVDKQGQPFPQCDVGRCRPDGACPPGPQACSGECDLVNFPCPTTSVANCRCQLGASDTPGACVDCPTERICGFACCPEGQICCDGICTNASELCGGICGNVCAGNETCCGTDCVPTIDVCGSCDTICTGDEVCCDTECVSNVECCLAEQCSEQVCETAICNDGTCEYTAVPPNQQGPLCDSPGEVCCEENGAPVCCQTGEVCIAEGCCLPLTCSDFPGLCGPQDDGCGGLTANCPCPEPQICIADGTCCSPLTCAAYPGVCGPQDDGCDGLTADCPCPDGQTCTAAGTCITPECVPESIEVACAGLACGPASNGCGVDYDCGTCGSKQTCVTGVCKATGKKRCVGSGLAGQPCGGKKCKCKRGRRCHNGRCCEPVDDGTMHCSSNNDCCPGLMCARRRPGQHKVCMRRNAKEDFTEAAA